MSLPDDPLWTWALGFYARPGVAPACLVLQDRLQLDVCVLLHALFRQAQGQPPGPAAIAEADAHVRPWRSEVVVPLRQLRRRMKAGWPEVPEAEAEAARSAVKAAELQAERVVLSRLYAWGAPPRPAGPHGSAAREVCRYFAQASGTTAELESDEVRAALATLEAAASS
ncbi:TIGR02444 family protein [Ramlibacter sp. AW1]|uniref:TIGR02444 family protein n=1 Tax=Ramlibacter aurantiacus TaxID=2801330 RepID=A0A936ZK48_9BURK|nr:TIGR02444 family protein [Ramlibacter aurantiacus]MBL0419206.1 TIGR02444 family protein [Ramlibacter aurantiacus]